MRIRKLDRRILPFYIIPLILLALIPFVASNYVLYLSNSILTLAILSLSFSLLYANTGYMNLGHSVFYGLGAYTFAIALNGNLSPAIGVALALALVLLGAAVSGIFVIRLRGAYYAISTLAFALLAYRLAYNLGWLTNGYQGIITKVEQNATLVSYFVSVIMVSVLIVVVKLLRNSKTGYRIRSVKGDEIAAGTLGIDVARAKILALMLSSFFAGSAGVLSTYYNGFVTPESAFGISITFFPVIMAILLGSSGTMGPLLGVLVVALAIEMVSTTFPQITHLILGLLLIVASLSKNALGSAIAKVSRQVRGEAGTGRT